MSEEENIRVYQPWSAPLLHFNLSVDKIKDLLEITDLALEDENKKSYNDKLAGEIENEWEIPDYENLATAIDLPNISLTYFKVFASQNYEETEGDNTNVFQNVAVFAQNLEKSGLNSA